MSIKILPPQIRDQIAAGEVVERPASIVKELVENSIDAAATEIVIKIKNGGKDLIEIQDNGLGMNAEDAELALERYATSKIEKVDDLYQIHTFGFRGEALASIASVANLILQTKQEKELSGTEVSISGGKEKKIQVVSLKTGTKILIKNLFFNIPARLKFLKADSTENTYILKTIQNFAIIYPEISFKYYNNEKLILDLMAEKDEQGKKKRLEKLFRKDLIEQMSEIELDLGYLKITGFTVKPQFPHNNRNYQYVFVNQRYVEDRTIKAAIAEAYQNLMPQGSQPAYFISLEIAPDLVDVNVHPRKIEVKFLKQQEVYQAVKKSISESFAKIPQVEFTRSSRPNFQNASNSHFSQGKSFSNSNFNTSNFKVSPLQNEIALALDFSRSILMSSDDSNLANFDESLENNNFDWKIIGQVAQSYILVEKGENIYFIDQHAADERIKYEEVKKHYQNKSNYIQKLLIPIKVEVANLQKEILEANQTIFENLGFEIDSLRGNTFLIYALPQDLANMDIEKVFLNLIDDLQDDLKNNINFEYVLEKSFKYIACRSAVMFGDKLSQTEMQKIIQIVFEHPEYQTCPHGRPFLWQIPLPELKKKFKR